MPKFVNIICNRLRLIYHSSTTRLLLVIIILVSGLLMSTLYKSLEESSKIPIAVVDESQTVTSTSILERVSSQDVLSIQYFSRDKGLQQLQKGNVQAVYRIKEGLEQKILQGQYEDLVEVYYLKGSTIAKFISDIFAAQMLYDINKMQTVINLDNILEDEGYDLKDKEDILIKANDYAESIKTNEEYRMTIDVRFVEIEDNKLIQDKNINSTLIYRQMLIGIMITFLAFFLLFASIYIVKDNETGLIQRVQVSSTSDGEVLLGNYMSLVLTGSAVGFIFSLLSFYYSPNSDSHTFFYILIIYLFYSVSLSALIVFFSSMIKKVSSYVMVFTIVIIVLGIASGSFWNIELINPSIRVISRLIPNYWVIQVLSNRLIFNDGFKDLTSYCLFTFTFAAICLLITYFKIKLNPRVRQE